MQLAPRGGSASEGLNWYNVAKNGYTSGVAINQSAIDALVTAITGAGGGAIYFPPGDWDHPLVQSGFTYDFNGTGDTLIKVFGAGPMSKLTWGGDAGGSDCGFIRLRTGVQRVDFEGFRVMQKNLTNPNSSEQHSLIRCHAGLTGGGSSGQIQQVRIQNVDFGVCKGDAINVTGNIDWDQCKANIRSDVASGALSGPFTGPTAGIPARIAIKYPGTPVTDPWDGGSFTITGTDINDMTITETIPSTTNDTAVGYLYFKTVTGITKNATGAKSMTANIGYAYEVSDVLIRACRFNGFEYAGSDPGYGYRAAIVAQRLTKRVTVRDCWMDGSDDQIFDFEATGNGDQTVWIIEGNTFFGNSVSHAFPSSPAITLYGNGNTTSIGSLLLEHSSFSFNTVYCRVSAAKIRHCKFNYNTFLGDGNTTATEALLGITDTCEDVDIIGNKFITPSSSFAGRPLAIESGSGYGASGLRINDNTVEWYSGAGIIVKDAWDIQICRNRLIYRGSGATDDGISTDNGIITNVSGFLVDGNAFESRGSTAIRRAINVGGAATGAFSYTITNNYDVTGSSVTSSGVRIPAATYKAFVVATNNHFPGCSTPVTIGTDVLVVVAGNPNGWAMYRSTGADPNSYTHASNLDLDDVQLGSMYSAADGKIWLKVSAGASGWKLTKGVKASGTVVCVAKASLVDTDYVTIGDGIQAPKLYEFDTAGDGVTAGRIQVNVSTDTSATDVANRLKTAIETNQPSLTVVNTTGTLAVTSKIPGTFANVTITENVANAGFTVTGLTGGVDPV